VVTAVPPFGAWGWRGSIGVRLSDVWGCPLGRGLSSAARLLRLSRDGGPIRGPGWPTRPPGCCRPEPGRPGGYSPESLQNQEYAGRMDISKNEPNGRLTPLTLARDSVGECQASLDHHLPLSGVVHGGSVPRLTCVATSGSCPLKLTMWPRRRAEPSRAARRSVLAAVTSHSRAVGDLARTGCARVDWPAQGTRTSFPRTCPSWLWA
jgi:hypothetical protein